MADAVKVMAEHGLPDAQGLVATFARSLRDLDDYNFVAALVDRMEYFIDLHERQDDEEEGRSSEDDHDHGEDTPVAAPVEELPDVPAQAEPVAEPSTEAVQDVCVTTELKPEKPRPKPRRVGQTRTVADLLHEARA